MFETPSPVELEPFVFSQPKAGWIAENFLPGVLLKGNGGLPLVQLLGSNTSVWPNLFKWSPL